MDEDHSPDIELEQFKQHHSLDDDDDNGAFSTARNVATTKAGRKGETVATATLSWQEKKNLVFLYFLYFAQALPLAFSWFTMPILLRQQLSYTLIGTYLVSQYPYSVKVAWSPVVQSCYLPALGRRKSWIVPCFLLGGLVCFWLAFHQDDLVSRTADGESAPLVWLVVGWLVLMFLCSCLRIATDDWSLELLSQANVHLVSTSAAFGDLSAGFCSFQLFLGFSSLGDPNAGTDGDEISTKPYFCGVGALFVLYSILVLLMKHDATHFSAQRSVRASYNIILRILKLRQVWILILLHMTSMIGFMANDSIVVLQYVRNGFTDLDVAGLATITAPFSLISGIVVTHLFRKYSPLNIWRNLYPYRLLNCVFSQVCVLLVIHFRTHHWRWFIALVPYAISRQLEDMMWLSLQAFHTQVADPAYGGIYLPLLATSLNIRYDLMGFIVTKTVGWIDAHGGNAAGDANGSIETPLQSWVFDGYQIVNLCSVLTAVPVFWFFLRPATIYLEKTEREDWRVGDGVDRLIGESHQMRGEYHQVAPTVEESDDEDDDGQRAEFLFEDELVRRG